VRTCTLKEVSKIINVSASLIKQWEKDLSGLLTIPRSKQGARIYSEIEIDKLLEIKNWQAANLGKAEIREILQKQQTPSIPANDSLETAFSAILDEDEVPEGPSEISQWNKDQFFLAMDQYKKTFLNEVKNEIRSVVRTEVVDEVKKEISKGNLFMSKSFSDSLYKASANMQEDIKELSFTVQKATDLTDKTLSKMEKAISEQSLETSEEFYSISRQLAETSEELSHYINAANIEINALTEAIDNQREYFMEDREKFRHEIRQREIAFQGMLSSFREAAATKEKKWWKFW
jgi:DNA-binding transcriptional MerR regulator